MSLSRRAFGLGLLGLSAVATGAYLVAKDQPGLLGSFGPQKTLFGFVGGEKAGFLENARVIRALAGSGLKLDGRRAGSVEMVREQSILDQKPQFLWPSSSVMVEIARGSGLKIRNDEVIFNSPIVIYSWSTIADGLEKAGLAARFDGAHRSLDLAALLKAILAEKSWSDVGAGDLYGRARIVSTDPNRSNSGFMFAGLMASLFAGDVVTQQSLPTVLPDVAAIFRRMGFKSYSSGKLFEDFLAGGPGANPLVIGYENQLVEWIVADPERWTRFSTSAATQPVVLYPRPTVYSAHPLIVLDPSADPLPHVLLDKDIQDIAWHDHGFRGPFGTSPELTGPAGGLLASRLDAILPMPDAATMLNLLAALQA